MKKLLIVRHAKSSWDHPDLSDFDRPLNERGLRNGPEMADRLRQRGIRVSSLLSSPAVRAAATAEMIAPALGLASDQVRWEKDLYLASPSVYTYVVQRLSEAKDSVAVVGHNPSLTEWANALAQTYLVNVPTLGMVYIEFPHAKTWQQVGPGKGTHLWFDYPKKAFPPEED